MYLSLLLVSACLAYLVAGTADMYGCEDQYKEAATKIHDEHCPELAKMTCKNVTLYPDCVENHGYPFYESEEYCSTLPDNTAALSPLLFYFKICNPKDRDVGIQRICCVITKELNGTNKPGMVKYDVSKECIAEFQKIYGSKDECTSLF